MLTDYSPGYADTWEALDRRLQDVAALGKMTGKAGFFCRALEIYWIESFESWQVQSELSVQK